MHPVTIVPENVCRLEDCPLLESISIGLGSFLYYSLLELKGDELSGELMVRLGPSEVVVCGKRQGLRLLLQSGAL